MLPNWACEGHILRRWGKDCISQWCCICKAYRRSHAEFSASSGDLKVCSQTARRAAANPIMLCWPRWTNSSIQYKASSYANNFFKKCLFLPFLWGVHDDCSFPCNLTHWPVSVDNKNLRCVVVVNLICWTSVDKVDCLASDGAEMLFLICVCWADFVFNYILGC